METSIFFRNCQVDMFIKNVYRPKVDSCHWNRETLFLPVMFPSFSFQSIVHCCLSLRIFFCYSNSDRQIVELILTATNHAKNMPAVSTGSCWAASAFSVEGWSFKLDLFWSNRHRQDLHGPWSFGGGTGWKWGNTMEDHHRMAPVCWVPLFTEITGWSWCYINFSPFF